MIDPENITDFRRSQEEMEIFLVFAIAVAGRKSSIIATKINEMFYGDCLPSVMPEESFPVQLEAAKEMSDNLGHRKMTPLGAINNLFHQRLLGSFLELHRLGQYSRIGKCLKQISSTRGGVNAIQRVTIDQLQSYDGIGPKTARFFMLHCFPHQRLAVLDTHILSWLSRYIETSLGRPSGTVPTVTPSSNGTYAFWELVWLGYCFKNNRNPAQLDLEIWNAESR